MLLAWHITASAGWFALLATQVITPWQDLRVYLVETATIALGTGVWLALGSQQGLFRYWWLVCKQLGVLILLVLGGTALRGVTIPYARWAGLAVLWAIVWLSVARPGGRTPHGRAIGRRGRHVGK
jgi:uncharacterized membrane protein SirB2